MFGALRRLLVCYLDFINTMAQREGAGSMRYFKSFIVGAMLISICGCVPLMSEKAVHAAQGRPYENEKTMEVVERKPHPAYYLLLPVTFPLDVAFCPFEFIWFCNHFSP